MKTVTYGRFDVCAGVCIKDTKSALSGGRASRKLSYLDQVVELTYEGGAVCAANPALTHKSIISFVCKAHGEASTGPVLVDSDKNTCTHFFSWHTPLVCEHQVMTGGASQFQNNPVASYPLNIVDLKELDRCNHYGNLHLKR